MQRIALGRTGIETSAIGFGCASLGSRVDRAAGLRALAAAADQGVAWFDVAPAYGRGQAEAILGEFLKGRPGLRVCTKAGLAPPKNVRGLKGQVIGAVMPLARRVVATVPGLRGAIRRSGTQANRKLPLTGDLVRRSIDESLARLGVERIDLYGLHKATPEEIAREDLLRALEDILAAGKAGAISVSGDAEVAQAAAARGAPFGAVQIAVPAPGGLVGRRAEGGEAAALAAARAAGLGTIVHSVLGTEDTLETLSRRLAAAPALAAEVAAAGGGADPKAALARLLLRRALAVNEGGIVLVSMFSPRSLAANMAAAAEGPAGLDVLALLDRLAAD